VRSTNTAPTFFLVEMLSSMSCVSACDMVYGRPLVSKARQLPREQWVDDWFDTRVDESLVDFKWGNTAGIWDDNSLGPPMASLA